MFRTEFGLRSGFLKGGGGFGAVALTARKIDKEMVFTVRDSGIGMSEDEIAIAVAPFRQVDADLARRYEGAGLGLAVASGFVKLHRGSLTIESRKGEGTTVTVRLPIAPAATPAPKVEVAIWKPSFMGSSQTGGSS